MFTTDRRQATMEGATPPSPSPPSRSLILIVVVIGLLISGLVVILTRVGGGEDARRDTAGTTIPSVTAAPATNPVVTTSPTATTTVATTTPTTRPSQAPPPRVTVFVTTTGRLGVTREGTTSYGDAAVRVARAALSPDARTAVVEYYVSEDQTMLRLWDVTGDPRPVGEPFGAEPRFPALSPDGRKVAYASTHRGTLSVLVVRDLASGSERTWMFPDDRSLLLISWAPDNRRIATNYSDAEGQRGVLVFDTASMERYVPDPPLLHGQYASAIFRGATGTLLGRQGPTASGGDRVVEIDATSGAVQRTLFSTPFFITAIDTDATGQNILVVSDADQLYRWRGGSVEHVSDGVKAAEW